MNTAYLLLENGTIMKGNNFGARGEACGELVFTTGMTGYLETLTDKSYYGQIIVQTFPLIGNYGVIPEDFESNEISASAYIVKYPCQEPSNFRSEEDLDTFLKQKGVVGLCGIDTRALTKLIRENGVMNGKIMCREPSEDDLAEVRAYRIENAVEYMSTKQIRCGSGEKVEDTDIHREYRVALLDFGLKESIRTELIKRNCEVITFPHNSTLAELVTVAPDGIMLSNGPGDPTDNPQIIANIREMLGAGIPIFGICLGHQLLALANGFTTCKLKYGHRGSNQPVKDIQNNKIYITSQNHGYAVVSESIHPDVGEEAFINVNDHTCEGIRYRNIPAFSVQFHPEASSGPLDTAFLFDEFIQKMSRMGAAQMSKTPERSFYAIEHKY